jgi:predicted enzyme related to lactoylglutathione lyase
VTGEIVHFEVPANDTGRALRFYGELFGWSFQSIDGPVEYHMAQVSESLGGAIHRADQGGGIPGVFVYFGVEDIQAAARRVRDLGGTAEDPGAVPQMGWFARCMDTEGNPFGLWQHDTSAPAPR